MSLSEETPSQIGVDTFWHDDDPDVIFESGKFPSNSELHELRNDAIRFHNSLAPAPYDPTSGRSSEVRAPIYADETTQRLLSVTIDFDTVTIASLFAARKDHETTVKVEGVSIPLINEALADTYFYQHERDIEEINPRKPFDNCILAKTSALTRQKLDEFSAMAQFEPPVQAGDEGVAEGPPEQQSKLQALTARCLGALGIRGKSHI